ncbi:sulfate adenylyltransferase subunit CysN, partial [Parasphingorhabdus sp.]
MDSPEKVYETDALIAEDINAYLDRHQHKSMLRFITCGSVDDGKSTLIGRLLYDSRMIFEDQLASLEADSKKLGTQGQEIDFALLVDGLAAEREQGITIDVAYRFFATEKRKFIVADTPGHEQYTRNMVTGASTADLAIILIDARQGILTQTRRHSYLAHLLGIKHLVVAVNKMDLVGYDQQTYDSIIAEYAKFGEDIGIESFTAIPISGLAGDNIARRSENMPWYDGPSLVEHLETVEVAVTANQQKPFRMAVQWVNRPNLDFRGFSGQIASGSVKPGDSIRVLPSGKTSTVKAIVTADGELDMAVAGQSVTLTLKDEIDCSRGDVIATADDPPQVADQFESTLVWMDEDGLLPGRSYWMKTGSQMVSVTVQPPKYQINVNNMDQLAAKTLELNDIGVVEISTDRPIVFEPYADNRDLGGYILIDKISNATVAAGMLHFCLRRSQNVHWQDVDIDREAHALQKRQEPRVVWFTGLSGSGKS